ncbi:MAG: glycosyltransferase family 9 protein [Micromonosporaceae bacterium]
MRTDDPVDLWNIRPVRLHRGGPLVVSRAQAPIGRRLPYRRSAGQAPPAVRRDRWQKGWLVNLGDRGLGDVLLGLSMVRALADAAGSRFTELHYQGPRATLMRRCTLPMVTTEASGRHVVRTPTACPPQFNAVPERPPVWLDPLDDDRVEVHAPLPARYHLEIEMAVGRRLPTESGYGPSFTTAVTAATPFHVVFVSTTSMQQRKDYRADRFAAVAAALAADQSAPWRCTLLTPPGDTRQHVPGDVPIDIQSGLDAVDCLDIFASAELVIGNDTGLTHLAALTRRPDGTGPHVVGIYGRHAYTKWITGSPRHHAIATAFSQMLAAADGCPVRDRLDDTLWVEAASLDQIAPATVARFAGEQVGWW